MIRFLILPIFLFTLCATSDVITDPLYLGQDEGVQSIGLRIHLGEKDDVIYSNLLWHYRMGIRHFEVIHHGLSTSQAKKINMFHNRVKDICSLNLLTTSQSSEFSSTVYWIMELTDRQILCLRKPLDEILSADKTDTTFVFPTCNYNGFDPSAAISFWQQTDERLIYRTPINSERAISLNAANSSKTENSSAAYITNFSTMEEAVPCTAEMIRDQLPFMDIVISSIQHACLRGQSHFDHGTIVPAIINDAHEEALEFFSGKVGINLNIRFGKGYIYVPVEKSGCSTIARTLGSHEAMRLIDFPAYKQLHVFPLEVKERYQYLLSDSFFKFTCVRNPFNRALSAYLDKIMGDEIERNSYRKDLGFRNDEDVSFLAFLTKLKEKGLNVSSHFASQCNVMMYPYIPYDMIIKLENFDQEFQIVMDRLGIPGESKNYRWDPHATSAKSKLSDYYTQGCIDLVVEIYKRDFQFLNYSITPTFTLKID